MKAFTYLDTKFIALNGDLANIVSGGTAMLQNNLSKTDKKYQIRAKLPSFDNRFLSVEIIENQLIISGSVQTISKTGIVFNLPFASRAFGIPENVEKDKIEVFEKEGYLIVEMPESECKKPRGRRNIDINFDDDF